MTYYHGTKSKFARFTKLGSGKHGIGFYFAKAFGDARAFAFTLAGDGEGGEPRVYTVSVTCPRPFDTMNIEHCEAVARYYGFEYRVPRFAGGPKEHYHHLAKQLVSRGVATKELVNEAIKRAGFDGLWCEFFEHLIVFESEQIVIVSEETV